MLKFKNQYRSLYTLLKTIKEGEACIMTNIVGKSKIINGPKTLLNIGTFQMLDRFIANPGQTLRVNKIDGSIITHKGPICLFLNPLVDEKIIIDDIINIDENKAILVKERKPNEIQDNETQYNDDIISYIIKGPNEYIKTGKTISFYNLKSYSVSPNSHAVITYIDGSRIIEVGPRFILDDPRTIKSIEVKENLMILANQSYLVTETSNDETLNSYIVNGPKEFIPNINVKSIKKLDMYPIDSGSYAVISYFDGKVEHVRGPTNICGDIRTINTVEIKPIMFVESNETIVVYTKHNDKLTRKIIKGATTFVPQPNDTIHEFSWSGHDGKNELNIKIRNKVVFSRLKQMPHQMYLDVPNVRTKDDVLLTIKIIAFFDITNLEQMLDNTNDPIANISTGVGADVIKTISQFTFSEFKDAISQLNNLDQYTELLKTTNTIGITLNNIVFRGYLASSDLQKLHNDAVIERQKLILKEENQKNNQALQKSKVIEDLARLELETELSIKQAKLDEQLLEIKNSQTTKQYATKEDHYRKMSEISGMNINDYHKYLYPSDSKTIRIENLGNNNVTPKIEIK